MHLRILTIFPQAFPGFLQVGLLGKALQAGRLVVDLVDLRAFAEDERGSVDDAPYGGGSGMVMLAAPIVAALEAEESVLGKAAHRVLLSPRGKPFSQADARRLAQLPALTLVCGRYEGIDERVSHFVDEEISLGDFVLFGGEVAALAIVESVARMIPGVLGNHDSLREESHTGAWLEYPQYTRPRSYRGLDVPAVLCSGNHEAIAEWRRQAALEITRRRRPDLLDSATARENHEE